MTKPESVELRPQGLVDRTITPDPRRPLTQDRHDLVVEAMPLVDLIASELRKEGAPAEDRPSARAEEGQALQGTRACGVASACGRSANRRAHTIVIRVRQRDRLVAARHLDSL